MKDRIHGKDSGQMAGDVRLQEWRPRQTLSARGHLGARGCVLAMTGGPDLQDAVREEHRPQPQSPIPEPT